MGELHFSPKMNGRSDSKHMGDGILDPKQVRGGKFAKKHGKTTNKIYGR